MARAKPIRKGDFIQVMHQGTVFRATCTDARAGIISVAREFVPEGVGKSWFKREECKRLGDGPDTPLRGETIGFTFIDESAQSPPLEVWWINKKSIEAGYPGSGKNGQWLRYHMGESQVRRSAPADPTGWVRVEVFSAEPTPQNDEEE